MNDVLAVVVDDSADDRRLLELVSAPGLTVTTLAPRQTIEATVDAIAQLASAHVGPSVVLLDYRLDLDAPVHFRGGSVVASFREKTSDIPVVLLTTESRLQEWIDGQPGLRSLFDWQLIKGDIFDKADGRRMAGEALVSLAQSFQRIRLLTSATKNDTDVWQIVASAMKANDHELDAYETLSSDLPDRHPSQLARWIIEQPLSFPGPLVDLPDARGIVGVRESALEYAEVCEWMMEAAYVGVFAKAVGPRYWRDRLLMKVDSLFADGIAPEDSTLRAAKLSGQLGRILDSTECAWCGQADVVRCCSTCSRGADSSHSLRTVGAPKWSLGRIVCFACVAEGLAEQERFDAGGREIASMIRSGEMVPPAA